nr:uncharacterized protein LOC123569202 [Macaca fascicularis]
MLFSKLRIRALSSHQDSRSFLAGNRAGPGSALSTKEHSSGASSAARAPSRGSRGQDAPGQSPPLPRTRRPAAESLRPRSARESKNAGRGPRRRSGKGRQENAKSRPTMAAAGARRGRERTRRSFYSADGGPQESILPAQAAPPGGPRPCRSPARRWALLRGWRVGAWVRHAELRKCLHRDAPQGQQPEPRLRRPARCRARRGHSRLPVFAEDSQAGSGGRSTSPWVPVVPAIRGSRDCRTAPARGSVGLPRRAPSLPHQGLYRCRPWRGYTPGA